MSAEDRAVFYKILDKHVDELWLPDEYSAKQQRELLDTVARKIVEALSSEGLALVAREDVLTAEEARGALNWLENIEQFEDCDCFECKALAKLRRLSGGK